MMKNLKKMNTSLIINNSLSTQKLKGLHPWQITGISDGEGSFGVFVKKDPKRSLGYVITLSFEIALDKKDLNILKGLQAYFGVGGIYKHSGDMMRYKVSSIRDIAKVIIPHFDKYPLVTQKRVDFDIFKSIIHIVNKGPVSREDLQEIVKLKAFLNLGLSDSLKESFPDIAASKGLARPTVKFTGIPDPNWLSGFSEAEACFYISIYDSPKSKLGKGIQLVYVLTQHIRDEELLKGLIQYLGCGKYSKRKEAGDFKVLSIKDINTKIIPFFNEYPLQGVKSLNFNDWKLAAEIMENKDHLTEDGLRKIQNIKMRMNTKRFSSSLSSSTEKY
jgi:hypothetical protein